MNTLFERIGQEFIQNALTEFYIRAFEDPMIGHFFFNRDRAELTAKQIAFATAMLGGPKNYRGKPLTKVHQPLPIKPVHFMRRQMLMREVLTDLGLNAELIEAWLKLEQDLRPLILNYSIPPSCNT